MKNLAKISSVVAFSCLGLVTFNSCNKLGKKLQYDLDMQTASVELVIPPYSGTTLALSGSQTENFNVDSFIKANTANLMGVSNITSAKIKSCELTLHDATTALNFANFQSCGGSFFTDGNPTPFEISIPDNPDAFADRLTLPVDTSAELRGYLTNSSRFTYTLSGRLRRPATDSIHCTATFTFKVHVQAAGE
ncbi:MAG: hypothetical protein H7257_04905 [Taibaiella sp.]|nr:hypothetical protein [Taibaiella sp.]